jgi:hypothetical protein
MPIRIARMVGASVRLSFTTIQQIRGSFNKQNKLNGWSNSRVQI